MSVGRRMRGEEGPTGRGQVYPPCVESLEPRLLLNGDAIAMDLSPLGAVESFGLAIQVDLEGQEETKGEADPSILLNYLASSGESDETLASQGDDAENGQAAVNSLRAINDSLTQAISLSDGTADFELGVEIARDCEGLAVAFCEQSACLIATDQQYSVSSAERLPIEARGPPVNSCDTRSIASATTCREEWQPSLLASLEGVPTGIGPIAPQLSGLHLVDPDISSWQGQIIYLDFDGERNAIYNGPITLGPFDIPALQAPGELAGQEQAIMGAVLARLQETFAGTGVIFTTEQPIVGTEYSTIYIGGDDSAFASYGVFLGLAEQVDVGNRNPLDGGLIFSDLLAGESAEAYRETLAGLIEHEAGHLLGYYHQDSRWSNRSLLSGVAATVIFQDGFEGAFPGSWVVGNNNTNTVAKWGDNNAKAAAGSWSAFCADNGTNSRTTYDNNLNTYMQRQGISLAGYGSATLSFKYWMNIEPTYDTFQVNVRSQSGTWANRMTISGDQSSLGWQTKTINMTPYAGQTGLIVSFDFVSNSTGVRAGVAGVWVDDVSLIAEALPDLRGWDCYAPASAYWGNTITVQASVYNQAAGSAGTFTQKFYLSADQTWGDADDYYLGSYSHASLAGNTYGPDFSVNLPLPGGPPHAEYLTRGKYYIGMKTDANSSVSESDETNNDPGDYGEGYDWNDCTLGPKGNVELTLYRISDTSGTVNTSNPGVAKTAFYQGETVRMTLKADNTGQAVPVKAVLNIRAPDDSTWAYDSHPRGEDNSADSPLTNGETDYYSFDWTIPSNAQLGAYDVLAAIRDYTYWDLVYDTTLAGRNNDFGTGDILLDRFSVVASPPDLTVLNPVYPINNSAEPGALWDGWLVSVMNGSSAGSLTADGWKLDWVLSSNTIIGDADDKVIRSETKNDNFTPGQTRPYTLNGAAVSSSITTAGYYYFGARVYNVAGETNTSNNTAYNTNSIWVQTVDVDPFEDEWWLFENNDTSGEATDLTTYHNGGPLQGSLSWPGLTIDAKYDEDWYKFETLVSGSVTVTVDDFVAAEGNLDLWVYNASLGEIGHSNSSSNNSESVTFTATADQWYYVKVLGFGGDISYGSDFDGYRMRIAAPSPPSVPALNSRPGASATLYLDFNGDIARTVTLYEILWVIPILTFSVPIIQPYDLDGIPAIFSSLELDNIERIWSWVAEKYSPFNINVSTVDPGNLNDQQTEKAVIGGTWQWLEQAASGVSAIGGFYVSGLSNICYAFSETITNWGRDWRSIAETIAHEAGHSFGLTHQRSQPSGLPLEEYYDGDGSVVPIMGNNLNTTDRGLWWLTNQGAPQFSPDAIVNELAVLDNSQNGFHYRADDHGNSGGTATTLNYSNETWSASGVIERVTDEDWFSFSASTGRVQFDVAVAPYGAMLDATLELRNATGELIARSATSSLGESVVADLAGGSYRLVVKSNADYGDLGQYTIAGRYLNTSPTLVGVPDQSLNEDGVLNNAIDLWTYASDQETPDSGLSFTIVGNTNPNCGVSIDTNRYISIGPLANWNGFSDVSIRVSDGSLTATDTFRITVNPVNDKPTNIGLSPSSVAENQPSGTTVGAFSTTDPDSGNTFIYMLVGGTGSTDNSSFSISGNSLRTAAVFDYEIKNSYSIRVRSTDQDELWTEKAFTVNVTDVYEQPTIQISDASISEGDSGSKALWFTVTLSSPSSQTVTVHHATADTTAIAGCDYQAISGTLKFDPGQVSKNIAVTILGDTDYELDEEFWVLLSGATNAMISDDKGIGRILNDDSATPTATIDQITPNPAQPPSQYVYFYGTGQDQDGSIVAREWRSDVDGLLSTSEDWNTRSDSLTVGRHEISFRVRDNDGQWSDSATRTVTILNALPTATMSGVPSGTVAPSTSITLILGGHDNDENNQSIVAGRLRLNGSLIGDPMPGGYQFTAPASSGTYTLSYSVQDDEGAWSSPVTRSLSVEREERMQVIGLETLSWGFVATFNRPVDASILNLYDTATAGYGPGDVTMVGMTVGSVAGSLLVSDDGRTVTFIRTGGPLEADTYTLTFRSAANGFKDTEGHLLDGDEDGFDGGDYMTTMTLASSTSRWVSVPDFCRGPGQAVNVPATGAGIPIKISDGTGVRAVEFVLRYDPALLTITAVSLGTGLPADWSFSYDLSTEGQVLVTIQGSTALSAGEQTLVVLAGSVPVDAPYSSAGLVVLRDVAINEGAIEVRADSGIQVVAYLGDATGNHAYSGLDASYIARVSVGLDSGFAKYRMKDPVLIGDTTGNGKLSGLDASYMARKVVGLPQPQIPDLPGVLPPIVVGGVDPLLSVGCNATAKAGDTITLELLVDDAAGVLAADIVLGYDTSVFDLDAGAVSKGALTSGWTLVSHVDEATGRVKLTLYGVDRLVGGGGSLAKITAQVREDAPGGLTQIDLTEESALNEGELVLTLADGQIEIQPKAKTPVAVNDRLKITLGSTRFDNRTGQTSVELTIRNVSATAITGPLWLAIGGIVDPGVSLIGVDGVMAKGLPYIDLSGILGDGMLSAGETVKVRLCFHNPLRKRFALQTLVFAAFPVGT